MSIFKKIRKSLPLFAATFLITAALFAVERGVSYAAQDRFTLKAPNGISFSEFKGYEDWKSVAVSEPDPNDLQLIVANEAMINAYRAGIPVNGKAFPDGSAVAKIMWSKTDNAHYPEHKVPKQLASVFLIEKDSKRFPKSSGWGFAQFDYDPTSDTFKPTGDQNTSTDVCYACHTAVKATDYIFTAYPKR